MNESPVALITGSGSRRVGSVIAAELRRGLVARVTDARRDDQIGSPKWALVLQGGSWTELLIVDDVLGEGTWQQDALSRLDDAAPFADVALAASARLTQPRYLIESASTSLSRVA